MTEILTSGMLCREFLRLLSQAFGAIEYSDESPPFLTGGAKQKHVDILLEPKELIAPIDDLSESVLVPSAIVLADALKRDGAITCFHLDLPERARRPDLRCSVQKFDGMSVRCLLQEPKEWPLVPEHMSGKYILRFDVLYRAASAQIAA